MFAPKQVYPSRAHSITVLFDTGDLKQAALLSAVRAAFGEGYYRTEVLGPSCYYSLDLLPGGLRETVHEDGGQEVGA